MPLDRSPTRTGGGAGTQGRPRDERGRWLSTEELERMERERLEAETAAARAAGAGIGGEDDVRNSKEEFYEETGENMSKVDYLEAEISGLKEMLRDFVMGQKQREGRAFPTQPPPHTVHIEPTYGNPLLHQTRAASRAESVRSSGSSTSIAKELFKAVPKYEGNIQKPQTLYEFIDKVEAYFEAAELEERAKILIAASKLTSTAEIWWRTLRIEGNANKIRTWEDMKKLLMANFIPPEHETTIRGKMLRLKQAGTVAAYTSYFNQLAMQIPTMSQQDKQFFYIEGLHKDISRAIVVSKDNLASLSTVQMAAIRQEQYNRQPGKRGLPGKVEAYSTEGGGRGKGTRRGTKGWGGYQRGINPRKPKGISCFICSGNHLARYCPETAEFRTFKEERDKKQTSTADGKQTEEANFTEVEANMTLSTHRTSPYSITVDSAATNHIIKDRFMIDNYRPIKPIPVEGGKKGSAAAQAVGMGDVTVYNNEDGNEFITFKNVLYAPEYRRNLVSSTRLVQEQGYDTNITANGPGIYHQNARQPVLPIKINGFLPFLEGYTETTPEAFATAVEDTETDSNNSEPVKESTATSKN